MLIKGAEKVAMERAVDDEGKFVVWQEGLEIDDSDLAKGERASAGRIKGLCSSENRDRQEETILQKGLDFNEFLQYGFFNDNHNQATAAVLGVPESVTYVPLKGWMTEGDLYDTARAHEIVELSKAMGRSKRKRRLGFSIEGKATLRDKKNKIVMKAVVRNVAITQCPVNPECTWELVAKALVFRGGDELRKALPDMFQKALSAGSGRGWEGDGNGAVLRPESFGGDEDDLVTHLFPCSHCAAAGRDDVVFRSQRGLDKHIERSHTEEGGSEDHDKPNKIVRKSLITGMTEEEALEFLRHIRPGYSDDLIRQVIERAKGFA